MRRGDHSVITALRSSRCQSASQACLGSPYSSKESLLHAAPLSPAKLWEVHSWGEILKSCRKYDFQGMGLPGAEFVTVPSRSVLHTTRASQLPQSATYNFARICYRFPTISFINIYLKDPNRFKGYQRVSQYYSWYIIFCQTLHLNGPPTHSVCLLFLTISDKF